MGTENYMHFSGEKGEDFVSHLGTITNIYKNEKDEYMATINDVNG